MGICGDTVESEKHRKISSSNYESKQDFILEGVIEGNNSNNDKNESEQEDNNEDNEIDEHNNNSEEFKNSSNSKKKENISKEKKLNIDKESDNISNKNNDGDIKKSKNINNDSKNNISVERNIQPIDDTFKKSNEKPLEPQKSNINDIQNNIYKNTSSMKVSQKESKINEILGENNQSNVNEDKNKEYQNENLSQFSEERSKKISQKLVKGSTPENNFIITSSDNREIPKVDRSEIEKQNLKQGKDNIEESNYCLLKTKYNYQDKNGNGNIEIKNGDNIFNEAPLQSQNNEINNKNSMKENENELPNQNSIENSQLNNNANNKNFGNSSINNISQNPGYEINKDNKSKVEIDYYIEVSLAYIPDSSRIGFNNPNKDQIMAIEESKREYENSLMSSKKQSNIKNSFENDNKNNSYNCSNNLNNNFNNNNKERDIDPKNLNCTKSFIGHDEKVVSLIQLKSGYIATGSNDYSIRIWDIESGNCITKIYDFGYILCLLEFEPNFLLAGTSENNIALFNLNEPDKGSIFNFNKHSLWVNCLVKCDETYFASASNDSFIFIWNYNTKELERSLQGHKDCILTLIKLMNGDLCSGSADAKIRIWNWKKGNVLYELDNGEDWVKCLYQLKNGNILSGLSSKIIKIWNNEYQCINTLSGHEHSIRAFCQIDDNYFASASFDNTIKIWDINTLENVNTMKMNNSNVICIIKLKDNRLATCSTDKTIRIWE